MHVLLLMFMNGVKSLCGALIETSRCRNAFSVLTSLGVGGGGVGGGTLFGLITRTFNSLSRPFNDIYRV